MAEDQARDLARLHDQLKTLVRTEAKLHRVQNDLDHQLNVFRKLHALGLRIGGSFDLQHILSQVATFALYDLGFERSLVLLDTQRSGVLRVHSFDGYYDESWPAGLARLRFAAGDPLPRLVHTRSGLVHSDAAPVPELEETLRALDLGELLAFPMHGSDQRLLGIVLAGNSQAERHHYVSVDNEHSSYGLANLSAQATAVVNAALGHLEVQDERNLLEQRVEDRTRQLADALKHLEELDNAKSQFFANVSHELRTPLTLSIGPLEEILKRADRLSPPDRDRHLRVIHGNQLRLLKLINNLLEFAKVDAGQASARFEPLDVVQAVRFYLGTLEAAAEARGMRLSVRTVVPALPLFVDREKFERIVMNLLSNAFKFTPDGGEIEVTVRTAGEHAEILVRDSGVGIPAEALPRLFRRYVQVDTTGKRAYQGTGIGLALVKEYVRLHGGDVTVQSEPGLGSTFTVRVPLGSAHLRAESVAAGPVAEINALPSYQLADFRLTPDDDREVLAPQPAGPSSATGATVLIADDNPDMRRFVAQVLGEKYRVLAARDGVAALELARRVRPDLVVSDVMMPEMNGYELCRALKRDDGPLSRVPVILLSAKGDLIDKLQGLDHGADDYLVKPFNADELMTRVRNLIRMRRQELELQEARLRLVEAERWALKSELVYARQVQASILPKEPVVHLPGLSVSGFLISASTCSGDFWFYRKLSDERMLVVLGDVMGHGAGSAMITELAYGALNALVRAHQDLTPSRVLAEMNHLLRDATTLWMSMAIGLLDPAARRAVWSSAGHPAILADRRGAKVDLLENRSAPLGCAHDVAFVDHQLSIEVPTRFLVYSDGLIEAKNERGRVFGRRQLLRSFERSGSPVGDGDWLAAIRSDFETFAQGGLENGFEDDVTAVAISMAPRP